MVQGKPRIARHEDLVAVARLQDDFQREYAEPSPGPAFLERRIGELIAAGDMVALIAGDGPDGFALLRFRASMWSSASECYLAELYVVPAARGHGLGRGLMELALAVARERGAERIELGTSEADHAARALYESLGFVNREHPLDGPVMYVYELEL